MAAEAPPARSDSVLVRVDADASVRERAAVGRALDSGAGRALVGDWRVYALPSPVTLTQARERLGLADAAEAVQLDAKLQALETPDDPHFALQWDLPAIDAPSGWGSAGGAAPVTVAVIDTGVDISHPDLAGRLWQNTAETPGNGIDDDGNGYVDDVSGWNFFDWTNQVYSAGDGDSHGTHVAGTIAALRGNGIGVAGIADNARIMPLKFLKPGGGYTSDAIVAIQYAVDHGATVINASWGGPGYSQALCDAIDQAGDAGVLFVAAAGNAASDNDAVPMWPANCPSASLISVASTTQSDGLSSFSNRGVVQVDVGAPGSSIFSTVPGGGYGYKSGTSMAAPHVAGIAAVVAGLEPGIGPWQLKAAISAGGDIAPALAGVTSSGRRADLPGAIALAGGGVGADVTPPDPFGVVSPAEGLATSAVFPVFRWTPATDAQSGVSAYRLVVDGVQVAQVGPGASQATAGSPLAEGTRTWSVVAVDAVGNLRATAERTLLVDRTAPVAPAPVAPADSAAVAGSEVTLSWSAATDAVSGIAGYRVLLDGAVAGSTVAGVRTLRVGAAAGRHTWQVVAVDGAGNESTSVARSFTGAAAARRPVGTRPLRLTLPARTASGQRPLLRVQLVRPARVTFTVRRASPARRVAAFTRGVRPGTSDVALPVGVARRMRAAGTYVVMARAPGGMKDTVRLTIRR